MTGKIRALVLSLVLTALAASAAIASFNFTVTADPRSSDALYEKLLLEMKSKIGGQGVFQVCVGDIDPPVKLRAEVSKVFGNSAMWFPVVGNHDEMPNSMPWLRDEYVKGHDGRKAIQRLVKRGGPAGSAETTYSWDWENCHFILLNEYWTGRTGPGSDTGVGGNITPALLDWLRTDLEANKQPNVFVFGHEPAFLEHRHIHESLDRNTKNRDAFWTLLESNGVQAFFCGHTHFYSRYQRPGGHVWQVDAGNTRNADGNGSTFVNVTVSQKSIRYEVYRDPKGSGTFSTGDSWSEPTKR